MIRLLLSLCMVAAHAFGATPQPCAGPLSVSIEMDEVAPALERVIKHLTRLTATAPIAKSPAPPRFLFHLDRATVANDARELLPSLDRLREVRGRLVAGSGGTRVFYARGVDQVRAVAAAFGTVNDLLDEGPELRRNALTGAGLFGLSSLLKAAAPDHSLAAALPSIYTATFALCFLYRPLRACFTRPHSRKDLDLANAARFYKLVHEDLKQVTRTHVYAHLILASGGPGEGPEDVSVDQIYRRDPVDGTPELLIFARH